MHTVTVNENGLESKVCAEHGSILLDVLRGFGKVVAAPCGGRGTCGKCMVEIAGKGMQPACKTPVDADMTVTLAAAGSASILHASHIAPAQLRLDPGVTRMPAGSATVVPCKGMPPVTVGHGTGMPLYGIAVDIGTTTVVLYLVNLDTCTTTDVGSFLNPQARYGHDVVSRIYHCMNAEDGLHELQRVLVDMMNGHLDALYAKNRVNPSNVVKMTVVGNPTMLHLITAADPSGIAVAPYTPAFTEKRLIGAAQLGLHLNPDAAVIVLPSVSAFVGADIMAGVAATPLTDSDGHSLFIDIGTNGEMAMGGRDYLVCCSTAAGPAFEGANITCGVGGITGAISSYNPDGTWATIGNAPPSGICGSGLIDVVACLLDNGTVDPTGYMERPARLAGRAETATGTDILLDPQDIRQVQLAKAAIAAGIRVMMAEKGVEWQDVSAFYIGGAFGNFMSVDSAARIGLIPPQLKDKVVLTGNVAGKGALLALMSVPFEERIDRIVSSVKYLELSMHALFNEFYIMEMAFQPPEEMRGN